MRRAKARVTRPCYTGLAVFLGAQPLRPSSFVGLFLKATRRNKPTEGEDMEPKPEQTERNSPSHRTTRASADEPPPEPRHALEDPHALHASSLPRRLEHGPGTRTTLDPQPAEPAGPTRNTLSPLTVDAEGLADLLGVSLRTVRKLNASARLPRPISLGRRRLWPVREIEGWLEAGAPGRDRWETLKRR